MPHYLLAIDQGTTSTRAIVFNSEGKRCAQHQIELTQYYPQSGWVEHDAEEIWQSVINVCQQAVKKAGLMPEQIAGIGITNQRETTVIWNRHTGKPIYRGIVWQDRRTANLCDALKQAGHESVIQQKTGLLLDPYFSASKIGWLLDHVPGARIAAEQGELAFGTIDTFILWHLTDGHSHKTDATNASRTSLFNIHQQIWDPELLALFNIPSSLLPEVMDCCAEFGHTQNQLLWNVSVPITGIAGDQQAALMGQACFQPGMAKSTYGTGCFLVLNTGNIAVQSQHSLLTTIAYRLDGVVTYALEGSIFVAGAAVQWLRDGLKIIQNAAQTQALAESINSDQAVYLVPAFTGLGAPHWDPDARGALLGLTRDTGPAEIATAALQSVCYQTVDLVKAMEQDGAARSTTLRIDGGMVANDWMVQFLANILDAQVDRPVVTETTALGAAYLAGLQLGIYRDLDQIAQQWQVEKRFYSEMKSDVRVRLYQGWQSAVNRIRTR